MNKSIITRYRMLPFMILAIIMFQACDSESYDVEGETSNVVFINLQNWSPVGAPRNSFLFNVTRTPGDSWLEGDPADINFYVQSTKPASEDIKVMFEIDRSVTMDGYANFPEEVSLTMDKKELIIPKGKSISSEDIAVTLDLDKWRSFTKDAYILPIKIVSVSNAELSNNLASAYVIVKTNFTNCVNGATTVTGTIVTERSTWTAKADGEEVTSLLFDGNTRTYVNKQKFVLDVDLHQTYNNITGMKFDYYSRNYCMSTANIYVSASGTDNYEKQASLSFARATPQYVRFYTPVNARYIRVEILSPYSTSYGIYMAEFNLYQE